MVKPIHVIPVNFLVHITANWLKEVQLLIQLLFLYLVCTDLHLPVIQCVVWSLWHSRLDMRMPGVNLGFTWIVLFRPVASLLEK